MPLTHTESLRDLLTPSGTPCLSIYQPTHRRHPENRQDPIRFRNIVRDLGRSLEARYPAREVSALVEPLQRLADDPDFWNHTLDGLAAFVAPGLCQVRRLQHTVPELTIVANSFHLKPLLRVTQAVDRYQVLGVNRQAVCLFEGTRDVLDPVALASGVPATIEDALGDELTTPHLTVASYGGAGGTAMHHGHGSRRDEVNDDTERFFRVVDRAILEHHSRHAELPLMLAALPEHHAAFRRVSHNPYLLPEGVPMHPSAIPIDVLRERAWETYQPRLQARTDAVIDRFRAAQASGHGSDDVAEVGRAVIAGRVATLLVDADRRLPGRLDLSSGDVQDADLEQPDVDDLLDDLGEHVIMRGGEVVVLPSERMPTTTGLAATFRF